MEVRTPNPQKSHLHGLSLMEITIVVVIIGLCIGGLLTGQTLMRAAELRSFYKETAQYKETILNFQKKYEYIPGDMPNATDLWGAADGGDGLGADCTSIDTTNSRLTCNGNGNGQVQQLNGDPFVYEHFRFWQHLANADMTEGGLSGKNNPGATTNRDAVPGKNVPASLSDGSVGYTIFYMASFTTGFAQWFQVPYDEHVMVIGRRYQEIETRGAFLSAIDLSSMDSKYDDGRPATGIIRTWNMTGYPECTTSDTPGASVYATTTTESPDQCAMLIMLGF